ncbi:hypothetical protein KEM56_002968 [Ascosphaera pollenicola]|nr:hypothetical protein KEM56_002968 [Ascosphaera pollenicola]
MEIVGPINLLYTIYKAQPSHGTYNDLPFANKLVAGLYVLHYLNRAIITPLFFAPSMSPIHVVIALSAVTFNYLNSSCLAGWVLGYVAPLEGPRPSHSMPFDKAKPSVSNYVPYFGLLLFAFGMYGNIRSEHTLFRLRREAAEKKDHHEGRGRYDKVYVIPPAKGFFKTILFPHYVCEWIEWLGFAIVGFAVASPTGSSSFAASKVTLAPYYGLMVKVLFNDWGVSTFPLPPIMSFVNIAMTTAVRANSGRRWYVDRFGEKEVAGRGSVVPYCKWF